MYRDSEAEGITKAAGECGVLGGCCSTSLTSPAGLDRTSDGLVLDEVGVERCEARGLAQRVFVVLPHVRDGRRLVRYCNT